MIKMLIKNNKEAVSKCIHCSSNLQKDQEIFCCNGCKFAYQIINNLGLSDYYKFRKTITNERKIKPEIDDLIDINEFVSFDNNVFSISLLIQGLHCGACVWLIETILKKQSDVIYARVNLANKTLHLKWKGDLKRGNELVRIIYEIGYKLLPFDEKIINEVEKKYNDSLLKALAVAGFGVGNIMLFSISLWFSSSSDMGFAMRNFLHFFSSLVALPVAIYSARPFFISAYKSLKAGYPNMDLPISIAIFLACLASLIQSFRGSEHVYFDSAIMLIFFLLIGRYLDFKARKKAFSVATQFMMLSASFARIENNDKVKIIATKNLKKNMILLVAPGEKILADGIIIEGESEIDNSLISGESIPKKFSKGEEVLAGMINLTNLIRVEINKPPSQSMLAEIINIIKAVEEKKTYYVRIADRLSRIYTPLVHLLALLTFFISVFYFKIGFESALMNAIAVLIITCPCALALAIPIVQTIVISNFLKKSLLVKNGEVFEKISEVSHVIIDKTGSLTVGSPELKDIFIVEKNNLKKILNQKEKERYLQIAASLAKSSKHIIAQSISKSYQGILENINGAESKGFGISGKVEEGIVRLGRKEFCNINLTGDFWKANNDIIKFINLHCFMKINDTEILFLFTDNIKEDAKNLIKGLKNINKKVILLSGDIKEVVEDVANLVGIKEFLYQQTPLQKLEFLENLKKQNKKFMMIGDGLNDAPSLASADISVSFSKAIDISQNVADVIINSEKLNPVLDLFHYGNKANLLMKQNLTIALIYNLLAIPLAMSGMVVPLVAAIAMSSSSLLVLFNSFRIKI